MRTAFCGACGHIYEKGEDVSVVSIEKAHARCPACAAEPLPVMMAFKDLSEEEVRRMLRPADVTVRQGEDINAANDGVSVRAAGKAVRGVKLVCTRTAEDRRCNSDHKIGINRHSSIHDWQRVVSAGVRLSMNGKRDQ